jgi:hypothetical protein
MRRSALYILTILLAASACNKVVMAPQQMGTVALSLASDVEAVVGTKADNTVDYDSFLVKISGETLIGNRYGQEYVYSEIPDEMLIPFGSYFFSAESCTPAQAETSNEGFGCVRYAGTTQKTDIMSTETMGIEIECSMANAKVTLVFDDSFLEDFTDPKAELKVDDREIELPDAATAAAKVSYFNVDSENLLSYTIYGKINGRELSYTNSMSLAAAKWAKIVIKSNHNGQIGGPDIIIDSNMDNNSFTELIDPNEGSDIVDGSAELPSILVDTRIDDATVIDCVIDIF